MFYSSSNNSTTNPTLQNLEVTVGYNDTCINNTFMGTVNFTCVVVGGRTPVTIQWLVNGEVFTGDSHSVVISVNETASVLVIGIDNGVSVEQDLKYYACQVSNSVGNFAAFTQLLRCGEVVVLLTNLCTALCFWNNNTHYQIYNSI